MKQLSVYKPYFCFFLIFTISFLLIKSLFLFFLPFIIGALLSFIMYPVYSFMKRKLSFKPAFSATIITLIIFVLVIVLVFYLLYLLVNEALNLYYNNIDFFKNIFNGYNILDVIKGISLSDEMLSTLSNTAFTILRIIPICITLLIVSFVFTIFLINNLSNINKFLCDKLSSDKSVVFNKIVFNSKVILNKFLRSYLLLYFITFVESLFIFILIDIDYPLVFAFLASVADILPILGPGAVYFPIAVVCLFSKDILGAISLLVFWGIVVIIRQIIEPKIVSNSVKIHPLIIFSAIYFSIAGSNIWVLFYVILLALVYKILVEAEVLQPLVNRNDKEC